MTAPIASKAHAVKAGLWSTLDLSLRQGLQFVVSVVLARLLTPADFGVIAVMSFFTSLATVFVQGGFATALIQRSEATHEEESAIFWFGVIVSGIVALILSFAGGAIARFYGQPLLAPLMVVAAAQIVVSALGSVHGALLARALRFDLTMISGVIASVLAGAVGVGAAFGGWGVWALAAQSITAAVVTTVSLWLLFPWRPALRFRLAVLRPLLGFGSWLSLSSVLDIVYTQGSALLVGKLYGVRDLGLYNRAANTQQLPATVLASVIGRITLPLFAARTAEPEAVRRGLRTAIGLVMLVNVPAMIGLALLAEPVVTILFGEQWRPAAPILSILALSGILYPLHVLNLQTLLAFGGSARFFRIEISKKLIGVVFVVFGALFGVEGLAWAQVALSIVTLHLNAAPMGQRIGYGTLAQLRDLKGLLVPITVMIAVVAALHGALASPLVVLALAVPAGAFTYVAACALLRVSAFTEVLTLVRGMVAERRGGRMPITPTG